MKLTTFSAIKQSKFLAIAKGALLMMAASALVVSCDDDEKIEGERIPTGKSVIYFNFAKQTTTKTFAKDDDNFVFNVPVSKTAGVNAELSVTLEYNAQNFEDFKAANPDFAAAVLIPEDLAELDGPAVISNVALTGVSKLTFDKDELLDLYEGAPAHYVYPIKITGVTGSENASVSPTKNYLYLNVLFVD